MTTENNSDMADASQVLYELPEISQMNLNQKLLYIQRHVDSFMKDAKGHQYKYVKGDQVLNKIRPLMNEVGLLLKPEVLSCENERIDYVISGKSYEKDKSEIFSSVVQKFTWIDAQSGEREECLFHANGMNDWDKGLGSALTYAERYFLLKFFHVPTDGDDNDNRQRESEQSVRRKPAPPKEITKEQFNQIMELEKYLTPEQRKNITKTLKGDVSYNLAQSILKTMNIMKQIRYHVEKLSDEHGVVNQILDADVISDTVNNVESVRDLVNFLEKIKSLYPQPKTDK